MYSIVFALLLALSPTAALVRGTAARGTIALRAVRAGRWSAPVMLADEGGEEKTTDWDNAWQSEMKKRSDGTAEWRPEGREPVSAQQLAAIRAAKAGDDIAVNVQSWSGDWRFWLGIIAVISVATAALTYGGASDAAPYTV